MRSPWVYRNSAGRCIGFQSQAESNARELCCFDRQREFRKVCRQVGPKRWPLTPESRFQERDVEDRIADLHGRIHRGAYRAKPSRRVWIPKPDGRQRPLGIAALEDKIVQQAVLWVLQSIYEQDFLGFSYGFRGGRSQHDALDALNVALTRRRVSWVLDADIAGFFDQAS